MHKGVRGEQGGGGGGGNPYMPEFSPYPFPFYCLPCRVVNYLQGIHVYSWAMQPTNQPVVAP